MLFQGQKGSTMAFRTTVPIATGTDMAGLYIYSDGRVSVAGTGSDSVAIANLKEPIKDGDAANKKYVDEAIGKGIDKISIDMQVDENGTLSFSLINN